MIICQKCSFLRHNQEVCLGCGHNNEGQTLPSSRFIADEDIIPVSLDDVLAELRRELAMRDRVYANLVREGKANYTKLAHQYSALVMAARLLAMPTNAPNETDANNLQNINSVVSNLRAMADLLNLNIRKG